MPTETISPPAPKPAEQPSFSINTSPQFSQWMADTHVSLAVTTYQSGKLFFIGLRSDGKLAAFERTINRTMGMAGDGQTLWVSSLYQLWRFENALGKGQTHEDHDRLFVPQIGITTGDLDVHDIGINKQRRPIFCNTAFSCLAAPSSTHSFSPIWKPPFISKLAAGDRCHLNGLAMKDGDPAYVTVVGISDEEDGWRSQRVGGGAVINVKNGEIMCTGLSMPHSPRLYLDQLWLLNSGTGELGVVEPKTGKFEPVAFLPGYARGLAFVGHYAVVGLSAPRDGSKTFEGLPLDDQLAKQGQDPMCGVAIIDLKTFELAHWMRFEGVVTELYDIATLPGVRRPMALGFKTDEIERFLTIEGGLKA